MAVVAVGTAADREFYVDAVLPALATRLDAAFPEFGWRQDARGWVATNEEMTHRVLGVRADRVVAHGPTPSGFLVHGGSETLWTAYLNGGVVPRNETFREVVVELAARAGVGLASVRALRSTRSPGGPLARFLRSLSNGAPRQSGGRSPVIP